jgi:thiamine kinase-like enzyme
MNQMNQDHLKLLCSELQLGTPLGDVARVHGSRGGSFIWRMNSEIASYVIKQLAPIIDLKNDKIVAKYELSETIADRFSQQGISAISAISKAGKHLFLIDGIGYLVYPWVEGYTLGRNETSEMHALKIARVIAQLHEINLNIPEASAPRFDIYSNEKIIEEIDKAVSFKSSFSNALKENKNLILSTNDSYQAVIPLLKENTVITHGDLDQLNVLWNNVDEPILIDWESARRLNATRDVIRTSLSWSSGVDTENAALQIYTRMLHAYTEAGGILNINDLDASLHGVFGSQIYWLLYNIELFFTSAIPTERDAAENEINSVLVAMRRLEIRIPDLRKIL